MTKEVKVLLAEDDEHIAKLISFKLGKEGFSVTWAVDGERALGSVLSEKWEVIILDVMMPHLSGWQVLQAARGAQIKTPVLMLTAKGEEGDIGRAKQLGATHFLKKPFDPLELVRVLRRMIPDPEMIKMSQEFVASFGERMRELDVSLKQIYSQPISETFSDQIASRLHVLAHNLAGIAENYGFVELGLLAARVENDLLQAIGSPMGSVAVAKVIRLAKELEQSLKGAREIELASPTSSEVFPASEATP
jgi:DNA-binding response OmpR family regulator